MQRESAREVFRDHARRWRDFRYVYPVISRRARGLSIGVNLSPDKACNFDCIYCCVDRTQPPIERSVDLDILRAELEQMVSGYRALFEEPEFRDTPPALRELRDIAFSGDGEPTARPDFAAAARLVASVRQACAPETTKIVTITNACFLAQPAVAEALAFLDRHHGEIWAKLDAGTEAYFRTVNCPSHALQHVLDNILFAARIRPVVIQSMFLRIRRQAPGLQEATAYASRLRWLLDRGASIKLVQLYTVARRTAQPYVGPLDLAELERIAEAVRPLGVGAACFA